MKAERVLSLDISTKTGWNLTVSSDEGLVLEQYGQVPKIECPEGSYPVSFVDWAYLCYAEIVGLISKYKPDVLVIEETTANSKTSHSQKILEFCHFLVAKHIKDSNMKSVYILTGQWAKDTERVMSKEEKIHNKYVRDYKKLHGSKIAYDTNGKRIGKITKKHVSIRRANELFSKFLKEPLRRKDEDAAEGLLLAFSYHARRLKNG